ncbi:MAG TPA: TerC/Alx family metal homeostasis membrane protein [Bacteroidota bacterium]|nr:TerC/Alx family metal homeostasis membrane protein [Bacteroidota bacterium]
MSTRKAIFWSMFWVLLSLLINATIYLAYGPQKALEFFTGYVIEKSLSIDNLFVFILIFSYFNVQPVQQRRVLNYGIIGVVILRGALILLGTTLVKEFHWIMYVFGLILMYSGYQIIFGREKTIEPDKNVILTIVRKIIPISDAGPPDRFFFQDKGVLVATSLFVVLLIIETTDVVFAVDSIPAVFAITTDPLIVFSSNIMAVLGLRSMYFVLEKGQRKFEFMKYGIGVVLAYVGAKMLIMSVYKISVGASLAVVAAILAASVLLSYLPMSRGENGR